jgi:peptidoglycan/LPS O-acetylase OafA/YrhL
MQERFGVIDVFRGIFSSLIILFHLRGFTSALLVNNSFIANSDLFVDFFFILSGFVMAFKYEQVNTGGELLTFLKKRFLRIYPLHFIVLVCFIAIELLKGLASSYVHVNKLSNESNNIYTVITNLLLLNSVKFPGINDVSWNIASWSISAEAISYLVFGCTVLAINKYRIGAAKNYVYAAVLLVAAFALYNVKNNFELIYTFDYGFLRGIIGFFTGVLCYKAYRQMAWLKTISSTWFHIIEPLFVLLIIVAVCYGDSMKPYGFAYEILFFIVVIIFALERGWISNLLNRSKLLHLSGKYSYSIYMTHTLLLSLFNIVFIRVLKFPPSAYTYLFIPNYIIIFYVSAWTFKHIETRFNKGIKRVNS